MKALIWIIILILIGWGIWYFVKDRESTGGTSAAPIEQVEASGNADINLDDFQSKG